ncbi:MAG: LysE family translocator [Acidimicrobiia bacterium]|nr:LysE family translocator [Acidimicrobiia bacterium]
MPDAASLTVFILAALALLLVPGPAVLYIVARSVDQGRNAGLVSVVGVGLGSMVHVFAAALGLSALLVQSAVAFRVVKYLGAAYLIYLGIRRLIGKGDDIVRANGANRTLRRIFFQGIWVNILNPKTALFFFAFLPQFVNVDAGSVGLQILFLGTLLVTMGIITDGAYAVAAGSLGGWLKKRPRVVTAQRWFAGGVFVSLGLATALSGSKD